MPAPPIIYGADWCEDTRRTRRLLRRLGVLHHYRNVDEDLDALERATELNRGVRRTPVVTLADEVLVEPSNAAMTNTLITRGLLTRELALERLHIQNVGDLERCIRVSAGLLLLALKGQSPRGLRGALGLTGTGLLLTGMAGWCPVFHTRRLSSLNGPADRPDEAERLDWVTTIRRRGGNGSATAGSARTGDADAANDDTTSRTTSATGPRGMNDASATGAVPHAGSGGTRVFRRGAGAGSGFESGPSQSRSESRPTGVPRLTLIEPDRPQ